LSVIAYMPAMAIGVLVCPTTRMGNAIVLVSSSLICKLVCLQHPQCRSLLIRVGEAAEGELPSDLRGSLKSVGTISVSFWEITGLKTEPLARPRNHASRLEKIKQVSEKSLKGEARSHQVTYENTPHCRSPELTRGQFQ
jgi:hypothetical protein